MSRRGYAIALAAAVVVLVGSMLVTALVVAGHRPDRGITRGTGIYGGNGGGPGDPGRPDGPRMMGRGDDAEGEIPLAEAQRIASDWLATHEPGAQLGAGYPRPMGVVFPVTRDGVTVGTLVVSDRKGQVRYRELASPEPAPTPSGSA